MQTAFQSALNRIKAEDKLKKKTEEYLMDTIMTNQNVKNLVRENSLFFKRVVAVACSAVLVCGISVGAFALYKTPVSYLSLDINPSVELGVNAFSKVVSATAYNDDGKTVLAGQDVINCEVNDAVNTLVKSAAQNGFIAQDGSTVIAITSETDNTATATKLEEGAEQGAKDAVKSEGDTAVIQKENVALARRDEAIKLGITPGKLNLIQKLQAFDPAITVDEYKDSKVRDIMKKYVELNKGTISQNKKDKNSESSSSSTSSSNSIASSSSENTVASSQSSQASSAPSNNNSALNSSTTSTAANHSFNAKSVNNATNSSQAAQSNNGNKDASTSKAHSNNKK